ncbi:MAG TPA: PVC-type heme-binding CxxCH protein, partial [Planctomycetaceae bacterium]|nr:PVC-type heme-binding CxxCH protein [Planctomycetaceae bacterium]
AYFRKHLGDKVNEYTKEQDRIRLLVDTNGDGTLDRDTVFADGFNAIEDGTGAGVLSVDGNVYYACIPKLYLLRDENDDGQADTRETLLDGFGVRVAFRGHDMHGLTIGPDGRLYFSIGDRGYNVLSQEGIRYKRPDTGAVFRCELDGANLEVYAYGLRNPQELAFDDYGNLFTGDNNSDSGDRARWVYVVEGGDSGWRMHYQYLPDRGPWNRERIWYPYRYDPETTEVQPAYTIPPIANLGDGPSGLTYYPGVGLPDRYQGHFFMADFRGASPNSGIRSFANKAKGATFELEDSHEFLWSILATDVDFGYDGSLYLTDWVNGWEGPGKGRIYRLTDQEYVKTARGVAELVATGIREATPDELARLFAHADRRVRQQAQLEMVKRIKKGLLPSETLFGLTKPDQPQLARIHAIWGTGQLIRARKLSSAQIADVSSLLGDQDEEVRAQAARVLGSSSAEPILDGLREVLRHDESARVKHLAAISFGSLVPHAESSQAQLTADVRILLDVLNDNQNEDPVLRHSAVMGLVGIGYRDPSLLATAEARTEYERLGLVLALRRIGDRSLKKYLHDPDLNVVIETARAINDEPLDALTEDLAALATETSLYSIDPLMRRVINANFRTGTPVCIEMVSQIAASPLASEGVRREAAQSLLDWNSPGPLDRVLGSWRPLERTPLEGIAERIRPSLGGLLSGSEELRRTGIQVAAKYGIKEVGPVLWDIFDNSEQPASTRTEALKALASLNDSKLNDGLSRGIIDSTPLIRATARDLFADRDLPKALPLLESAVTDGTLVEQQAAIHRLSRIEDAEAARVIESLTKKLLAGSLQKPIQLDVLLAAKTRADGSIKELVTQFESQRNALTDPVQKFALSLEGGDAARGENVFFGRSEASCRRCHKINGSGGEVGPDLSKIAVDKDRTYLLEAIVNPDAKIAKGFETAVLVLDSGKVVTGIIKAEADKVVTLMLSDGTLVLINKDEIEERAKGKSGMPEDLVKQLSLADVRDLVEYLSTLKQSNHE